MTSDEEKNNSKLLKINIFDIDFYTTKPAFLHDKTYSVYRTLNTQISSVIRIYGSTDNGIKLCLHLHQYFPHLSIRLIDLALLCGLITDENEQIDDIPDDLLFVFIADLEREMKASFKTFHFEKQPDHFNEDEHFVYSTEVVWMKPLYGYHEKLECFIQFNFYSNWMVDSAEIILQKGFMKFKPILVYNHLEFLLQFYVDNQIYLNEIYLNEITIRKKQRENSSPIDSEPKRFCSILPISTDEERLKTLPIKHDFNQLIATSSCFLECDATIFNLVQITRKHHYPQDMFFTPSFPGIINLWNDHFTRAKKKGQNFRDVVSFLENKVDRNYFISDPIYQFFKSVLKSFINARKGHDFQAFTEAFTPSSSCKRSENDAIIQDLEDELIDLWSFNNEDMTLTQEQLNLQNDLEFFEINDEIKNDADANDECNRSLFDFDIGDEPNDFNDIDDNNENEKSENEIKPRVDVKISQIDGNDTSESESDSKSIYSEDIFESESVKSTDFENVSTPDIELDFNFATEQHSTPVQIKKSDKKSDDNRNGRFLRSSLKRFRKSFNFDTIEEDHISKKFRKKFNDKIDRISFSSTLQTSLISVPSPDFELDSIISNTSTNISFDGITIAMADFEEESWRECFQLTIMSMELHCKTRQNLLPDPDKDPIRFVIFSVVNEIIKESESSFQLEIDDDENENIKFSYIGVILVDSRKKIQKESIVINGKNIHMTYVKNEEQLLSIFSLYVQKFDPEILSGYITDTGSWGYLLQRCMTLLLPDLLYRYSRIFNKFQARSFAGAINKQPQLTGRVILNVWNLMRKEINLRCYTFENVCENLLRERVHKMTNKKLNELWINCEKKIDEASRDRVFEYYLTRVINQIKMLVQTNLVRRTFDLSCLFGMKFEDVLTRGTQYRVESMLLPLVKLEGFIPVRFTKKRVDEQNAAEEIPMVMEPQISIHNEPVAVLDFQSLYPSVMISHNYCFTTCLGKLKNIIRTTDIFGCHKLKTEPEVWEKLKDNLEIAPNGSVFVKTSVRKGLLSKMLQDLLYTRILVKNELKEAKSCLSDTKISLKTKRELKNLERKLDICQLGLKLIANVTYGYTSANMSGRMPCVDLADAIVSKGRETLERAILFINRWGETSGTRAKVIYGDTDSVFISFPGVSVEKAFEYSAIIAKGITSQNPFPMMIKVEKVYSPCILFAKKRYCGRAFEGPKKKPFFDAKGIETVRRDNCPAVSKILRKSIDILFENNGNIKHLKPYLQWQMKKIINGRMSNLADYIFAKEFWGLEFYTNITTTPSCIIAKQWIDNDPNAVPKIKQRIPYVIVSGSAKDRLVDLVRDPKSFLEQPNLRINSSYYIQRAIFPPLMRVLEAIPDFDPSLLMNWFDEVRHFKTKKVKIMANEPIAGPSSAKSVAPEYFFTQICSMCGQKSRTKLCGKCSEKPQRSIISMFNRLILTDEHLKELEVDCSKCQKRQVQRNNNECVALDCSRLYQFHQAVKDFNFVVKMNFMLAKEFK